MIQFRSPLQRIFSTAILLAIASIVTTLFSFSIGIGWLMPFLGAAAIYPFYIVLVKNRCYRQALGWVLWWAICHSFSVVIATVIAPERAAEVVLHGSAYTQQMFHWIETGEGAEGSFVLFLPIHLREYAIFSVLSLLSFGSAALILGTYLLDYMNFYVGQLILASANPWLAAVLGWPPWSMLRVVGYIATGLALSALGLSWVKQRKERSPQPAFPSRYLQVGLWLLVGDLLVKAVLAPTWQQLLQIAFFGGSLKTN